MTAYQWIDNDQALAAQLPALMAADRLYVDTEFMRERTYFAHLALVQINDGHSNLLIDPTTLADRAPLAALLASRPLVLHACSEDIQALKAWGGTVPEQLEDTQLAAALCGHDLQCGYQRLVKALLDVDVPKDATRTDWLQRPLTEHQLSYAVLDVHHLPALYQQLMDSLDTLGRRAWFDEECARLLADAVAETAPDELWRGVKGAAWADEAARARLQVLAAWRDGAARTRDLPRSFVIKDDVLMAMAQQAPQTLPQLRELGLHPSAVRRSGEALLQMINSADVTTAPPPLPGPPDNAQKRRVKRLRARVNQLAEALALGPEVLARRRWLEQLAREPDRPVAPLMGWRRSLVLEPLLEVIDE